MLPCFESTKKRSSVPAPGATNGCLPSGAATPAALLADVACTASPGAVTAAWDAVMSAREGRRRKRTRREETKRRPLAARVRACHVACCDWGRWVREEVRWSAPDAPVAVVAEGAEDEGSDEEGADEWSARCCWMTDQTAAASVWLCRRCVTSCSVTPRMDVQAEWG